MPTSARPHVLTITCHDLGRHLGCYGITTVRSPHLDRLAAEGARFKRAFCAAPQCSPSRAGLTTGRYPHSNGVMGLAHAGFDWDLGPTEQATPAILAGHGYETHLFGLQHVSPQVERLGFDRVHASGTGHGGGTGAASAPAVAEAFERALSERALSERDGSGPRYLEVNFFEPHRPYDYAGVEPDRTQGVWVPPYLPQTAEAEGELAALQGAIGVVDAAIGRILAALERSGLADDTLVVFSADHGLAMPRAKCTLYDPGIGVALLVRWPHGGVRRGRVIPELASNIDVLPTLLEAAEIPAAKEIQGHSLLRRLRDEPAESHGAIFAEKTFHSYYDPMRCIRTERHKLVRNFETGFAVEVPGDIQQGAIFRADPGRYATDRRHLVELYDLEADPLEQCNLADAPELAQVRRELDEQLWSWMEETSDPLLQGPIASPRFRLALQSRRERPSRGPDSPDPE